MVRAMHDVIARISAAGRAAWPEIVPTDELAARIALHAADPAHDAELYLASALALRDPAALRIFERDLVPAIAGALHRLRLPVGASDEVIQMLRVDLLLGDPPRISEYAGTGALVAWLRVTATRRALRLLRTTRRETRLDDALLDEIADPPRRADPTRQYLRARYTAELKQAVADAFAKLELRQRNLLRQHILDRLTIDDLAELYRVHRVTCSRWIAEARSELGRATRKQLSRALSLDLGELDTLLRFLDSDIELSVSRLLGAA